MILLWIITIKWGTVPPPPNDYVVNHHYQMRHRPPSPGDSAVEHHYQWGTAPPPPPMILLWIITIKWGTVSPPPPSSSYTYASDYLSHNSWNHFNGNEKLIGYKKKKNNKMQNIWGGGCCLKRNEFIVTWNDKSQWVTSSMVLEASVGVRGQCWC